MWIFLTLGMVVLAHLLTVGIALMAFAAAGAVVLYATRPDAETTSATTGTTSAAVDQPVPAESGTQGDFRLPKQPSSPHSAPDERPSVTAGNRAA